MLLDAWYGMRDFRKIEAWQRARVLLSVLSARVPSWRRATRLRNQTLDAAESIGRTIAEGAGKESRLEYARFLEMAAGSASELEHHLITAGDVGVEPRHLADRMADEANHIKRMLHNFRKRVLAEIE